MFISTLSARVRRAALVVVSAGVVGFFSTGASTQAPRFYPDDPIAREPESQDASKAAPLVGAPPDPSKWVLIREKTAGAHPGFTARDARGDTWFVGFDPTWAPGAATGSVAIATKIFWALGYNQVESFLTTFDPKNVTI